MSDDMTEKFRMFRRASGVWYIEDAETRHQQSLGTRDSTEAKRLLQAKNEAHRQPAINIQIARAYLSASDVIYFIGYPGRGRRDNLNSIGFERQPIAVKVSEVGQFAFYAECKNLEKSGDDFGGISGWTIAQFPQSLSSPLTKGTSWALL